MVYVHLRLHSSCGGFCQGVTNPPWILGLESFERSFGPFHFTESYLRHSFYHSGSRARCCHLVRANRIDRPEEFAIAMKTLGVRETRRKMPSCIHANDRPKVDCSFSSDGEEISEIHRICGEDVPDSEVQSIMPGQYVIHIISHLAVTAPSQVTAIVTKIRFEVAKSCTRCVTSTPLVTSAVLHHIARRARRS
jgi:hypothetical protein